MSDGRGLEDKHCVYFVVMNDRCLRFPMYGLYLRVLLLRHTGAVDARRPHLCEDLIQPLQRTVEMQFYPTRGASHSLTSAGDRGGGFTKQRLPCVWKV